MANGGIRTACTYPRTQLLACQATLNAPEHPLIFDPANRPVSSSPTVQKQMRAMSAELSRVKGWMDLGGRGFWDAATGLHKRNIWKECGYPDVLTIANYRSLYDRGGIASRIVSVYPKAAWPGMYIEEDEDPKNVTPFEASAAALEERLSLLSRVTKCDVLRGLGSYSVLLIGAPGKKGQSPEEILMSELTKSSRPETPDKPSDLLYLQPVAEDRAKIVEYNSDPTSPRHGMPEFYDITLGGSTADGGNLGIGTRGISTGKVYKVHWSRLIHMARNCLEDEVLGEPELKSVWNYFWDLLKIHGGGAEAAWKRADPGRHIDIPPDLEFDTTAQNALLDQFDSLDHGLSKNITTRGASLALLGAGAKVQDFGSNADALLKLIAGTKNIPMRKLVGSERGELASSQDDENWWDAVDDFRDEHCKPILKGNGRGLYDRLITYGYLEPPEKYEIKWPLRDEDTLEAKAAVCVQLSTANKAQFDAGGTPLLSGDEIRDLVLDMEPGQMQSPREGESGSGSSSGDRASADDEEAAGARSLALYDVQGLELLPRLTGMPVVDRLSSPPGCSVHSGYEGTVQRPENDPGLPDRWDGASVARVASRESPAQAALAFEDVTKASPEPSWKAVHRAADANVDPLSAAAFAYYQAVRDEVDEDVLAEAFLRLSVADANHELNRALETVLPDAQRQFAALLNMALLDGALASSRSYRARGLASSTSLLDEVAPGRLEGVVNGQFVIATEVIGPLRTGRYYEIVVNGELRSHTRTAAGAQSFAATILNQRDLPKWAMDVTNPKSLAWARTRAAELITEITPDTKLAVRAMIGNGFELGIPPRKLAQSIKQAVGLRTDQVAAIRNLRKEMQDARVGDYITRFPIRPGVRASPGFRVRVPAGDRTAWIEKQTARYTQMQHRYRSVMIARSETMRASGQGQRDMWRQNRDRGYLDAGQKRFWIVTPDSRLREEHAAHEGEQVGLDEPWPWGYEVGEEIHCRCGEGLVDPEAAS